MQPEKLWGLFQDLVTLLPEEECEGIIGVQDEEMNLSALHSRTKLLSHFTEFREVLTHDCFLQFGILHDHETLTEVLVSPTKYIQFWGSDESAFLAVMKNHGLEPNSDLAFFDEFLTIAQRLPESYPLFSETVAAITKSF